MNSVHAAPDAVGEPYGIHHSSQLAVEVWRYLSVGVISVVGVNGVVCVVPYVMLEQHVGYSSRSRRTQLIHAGALPAPPTCTRPQYNIIHLLRVLGMLCALRT